MRCAAGWLVVGFWRAVSELRFRLGRPVHEITDRCPQFAIGGRLVENDETAFVRLLHTVDGRIACDQNRWNVFAIFGLESMDDINAAFTAAQPVVTKDNAGSRWASCNLVEHLRAGLRDQNLGSPARQQLPHGFQHHRLVVNHKDEELGDIKEIMLDMRNGKVGYVVMSFGGFLGVGEKLFAVPWNALKLDTTKHRFVLNIERDRLNDAPGFDKDRWPDMADHAWTTDIHAYYGTKPYWGDVPK